MDSSGPELLLGMATWGMGQSMFHSQQTVPSARGAAMQTCQPRNVSTRTLKQSQREKNTHVQQNLDNETMILSN
jgi:hypothetical protein